MATRTLDAASPAFRLLGGGGDTVVLIDRPPPEVVLEGSGLPGGAPVSFTDSSSPHSGLPYCRPGQVVFASSPTGTPVFGDTPM